MAAATVNAFAMIGSIAGGYYCFLIILGLLIAAVGLVPALLLRRFPILAWIVGLGVTALVSYLLAVSAVYASYDATFLRVFYVTPPTGIRFVSAQRSLALSDGAAIVVIDGVSRAELDPLLASGGLTRDQARGFASPGPGRWSGAITAYATNCSIRSSRCEASKLPFTK